MICHGGEGRTRLHVVSSSGANERGVAFKCFQLAEERRIDLVVCPGILTEVKDVLSRPELMRKFKTLTSERSEKFLDKVLKFAELQPDPPREFSLPRDPDDEVYLNLALGAGASYLVTWNDRHLTYLMRQDTPEGRDFFNRFPNVTILDPVSFVRGIERAEKPGG